MTENIVNGLLGDTGATELDIVDLTDNEVVEVIDGLGKFRAKPNYRKAVTSVVSSLQKRNKRNIVQVRKSDTRTETGKAKFEKRISQIENEDIRRSLVSGASTIADFEVYAIKKADSDTVDMFLPSDTRAEGKTNINNGQLNNREAMLVTHIAFQEGTVANAGDEGATADFKKISANTANGDFNFKNGQKIFAERGSMDVFKIAESNGLRNGEIELEVPKLIQEAKDITFETKLPAIPADKTYFKIMLKGVIVVKA